MAQKRKKAVHVLDYVAGNIRSLANAIEKCGYEVEWVRSPRDIEGADKLILPGVGHFSHCLKSLSEAGYLPAIRAHIANDKPFFGICVGLQALFSGSEEAPGVAGLGIIECQLRRFDPNAVSGRGLDDGRARKSVPCIGWNSATTVFHDVEARDKKKFYGLDDSRKYYYVHSYFAPYSPGGELDQQGWTVATATYGNERYAGAIGKGNVFATQFHPEKSGRAGLQVIQAFLDSNSWEELATSDIGMDANATDNLRTEVGQSVGRVDRTTTTTTNGLTRRIIACLDVRTNDDGDLVVTKGDQYDVREKGEEAGEGQKSVAGKVRNLGKPVQLAEKYYLDSADEIIFLNITAFRNTPIADLPMLEILRQTSRTVFVPLTIGGGIRDTVDPSTGHTVSALEVAKLYFASGADKVSIGSEAVLAAEEYYANGEQLSGKTAIETISAAYGCQAVVVSVDPKRIYVDVDAPPSTSSTNVKENNNTTTTTTNHHTLQTAHPDPATGRQHVWYQCTISGGRASRDLDVIQLAQAAERMGAGEILLNAIDRDGSGLGFDLELLGHVKAAVGIPVVASSGAGHPCHFDEVFTRTDVDAALGAGMFHRGECGVGEVKAWIGRKEGREDGGGLEVRWDY